MCGDRRRAPTSPSSAAGEGAEWRPRLSLRLLAPHPAARGGGGAVPRLLAGRCAAVPRHLGPDAFDRADPMRGGARAHLA